jgi:ComF family protein
MLRWLAEGMNLIYPPSSGCALCGDGKADHLCYRCLGKLTQNDPKIRCCPLCGRSTGFEGKCSLCADGYYGADGGAVAYDYQASFRELILAYKFKGRRDLAPILARTMAEAARGSLPLDTVDALSYVPVHWLRFLQRGYDQAEELAKCVSEELKVPLIKSALRRTKYHQPLSTFSGGPGKRRELVSGCFSIRCPVRGKTLLLIDDILTTGATLTACAQELKKAGAARVYTLVAAAVPENASEEPFS